MGREAEKVGRNYEGKADRTFLRLQKLRNLSNVSIASSFCCLAAMHPHVGLIASCAIWRKYVFPRH